MRAIIIRQGDKYGEEYTRILKSQLKEQGCDVTVFGDQEDADIKLSGQFTGWWSKLELFSPHLEALRPFLYVDLDSFVLGRIPKEWPDKFLMCREWNTRLHDNYSKCQSSVMWIPKDVDHIWNAIDVNTTKTIGGDQAWLQFFSEGFIQDLYPSLVGSYKLQNKEYPIHRIITFHGRPKAKDAEGWAEDLWHQYTI